MWGMGAGQRNLQTYLNSRSCHQALQFSRAHPAKAEKQRGYNTWIEANKYAYKCKFQMFELKTKITYIDDQRLTLDSNFQMVLPDVAHNGTRLCAVRNRYIHSQLLQILYPRILVKIETIAFVRICTNTFRKITVGTTTTSKVLTNTGIYHTGISQPNPRGVLERNGAQSVAQVGFSFFFHNKKNTKPTHFLINREEAKRPVNFFFPST